MQRVPNERPPFRELLFHMLEARCWELRPDQVTDEQRCPAYTLLLVAGGDCSLYVESQDGSMELIPALEQGCFILPPGERWYISNYSGTAVCLYRIMFKVLHAGLEGPYTGPLGNSGEDWKLFPYLRGLKLVEQLAADEEDKGGIGGPADPLSETKGSGAESDSGFGWLRTRQLFQELIGMLLEQRVAKNGPLPAARQSIRYMDEHYMLPLTVKQLAEQTGMDCGQYASVMRRLTGLTPLEYLNKLRIKRAKQLLLKTDSPLRDIARQVGFADEYYFNRRFRQMTAMTPRQYAQSMRGSKRIFDDAGHEVLIPLNPRRVVYYGEALGDFWMLDIWPVGSNLYGMEHSWLMKDAKAISGIKDIGIPFHSGRAERLEPDLIVLSLADDRVYREASRIAPTIVFNSHASLESRLRTLGVWFDRQEAAERVIQIYHQRLETAHRLLASRIRPGETASVFLCHRGSKLFVMGALGLSGLLYRIGAMRPPEALRDVLDTREPYRMIGEQDIPRYAGERIFVPLPENADARRATERLLQSERWQSLPAVSEGRVHLVEESKWNWRDAYSRLKQLEPEHMASLLDESSKVL